MPTPRIRSSTRSRTRRSGRRSWRSPRREVSASTSISRVMARPPSLSSDPFSGLFVGEAVREATSDVAWLQAMLDFESALAAAEAEAGLIPGEAAEAIAAACDASGFDPEAISRDGRSQANPAVPLVAVLREKLGDEVAGFVHHGATSQDALDTAAMLVAKRTLSMIRAELDGVADACAKLADQHCTTVMARRTLL